MREGRMSTDALPTFLDECGWLMQRVDVDALASMSGSQLGELDDVVEGSDFRYKGRNVIFRKPHVRTVNTQALHCTIHS